MSNVTRKAKYLGTKTVCKISPKLLSNILYKIRFGKFIDFNDPKGFNEKLQWLKFNYDNPNVIKCGDKYDMHEYVRNKGCEEILNEIYGVYYDSKEIDYNKLPLKFALKGTHGCGFNIICKDKSKLDIIKTNKTLDKWLNTDYSYKSGEIHYRKMKPKIIAEKFIESDDGESPTDYKVYCFNGKPYCTMVCKERRGPGGKADYYYFDNNWNRLDYEKSGKNYDVKFEKPESFEKMLKYSEILSEEFPFVRMDFYDTKEGIILGEMTFTPCAALDNDYKNDVELLLGDMINIKHI